MSNVDLGALQRRYTLALSKLIDHVYEMGFEATLADGFRSDEQAAINALSSDQRTRVALLTKGEFPDFAEAIEKSSSHGIKNSVHRLRLAQDLNLFHGGVFLQSRDDYEQFGAWWKSQNPDVACWGGDWGDSDHFSFEYQGVK